MTRKDVRDLAKIQKKRSFGKDMLMLLGAGLTAGLVLIAAADRAGKKFFEHYEEDVEFDD